MGRRLWQGGAKLQVMQGNVDKVILTRANWIFMLIENIPFGDYITYIVHKLMRNDGRKFIWNNLSVSQWNQNITMPAIKIRFYILIENKSPFQFENKI